MHLDDTLPASGSSMFPFVPAGSVLSLVRPGRQAIGIGDVVCYPAPNRGLVAHRVVALEAHPDGTRLVMRGDAQRTPERIPLDAVAWIVDRVEHRWLRYDTASATGRAFARIAVTHGVALRAAGWTVRTLARITKGRRRPRPRR